jgi:alanine racemase
MDLAIVDVTDLPEDAIKAGDPVEFFGPTIDLDDFASRSGTIGYHLLTSLGPRYRRDYVRGQSGSSQPDGEFHGK